jgi:tetratricopeptide (TPR) repeat protein
MSKPAQSSILRRSVLAALLAGSAVWGFGTVEAAPPQTEPAVEATEPAPAPVMSESFGRFMVIVDGWDLDAAAQARDDIADARERALATGILYVYEARYAEAESTLAAVVAGTDDAATDPVGSRAAYYLDIARGATLALGLDGDGGHTIRSADGRFEAVFADARDEILAPYLFEAMAAAFDELGADVGVRPDHPIRFEIYDDPGKLALVTPLTLDNIYTTGTVGICKYRRIMMITPRVMVYGYGWLDTAVHEYVHYLVTMRTQNNAPVWMQEGLAKLMETRWRVPASAAGEQLTPTMRELLRAALESGELVTLEQMHPSVAMLPSQELAALAYAEAETMLGLLEEQRGDAGLSSMLDDVAGGVDAKVAFADAWGDSFDAFFEHWKATMRKRTASADAHASGPPLTFKDGETDPNADPSLHGDVFSHLGGGRARKHARLGVLLTLRDHPEAAVLEYEKARAADAEARDDPQLARRLGELYLELGRAADALPLLILAGEHEPDNPNIAAAEARARRLAGDAEGARAALDRAVRQNPFIPGIHCDLAALASDGDEAARERAQCME